MIYHSITAKTISSIILKDLLSKNPIFGLKALTVAMAEMDGYIELNSQKQDQ